MCNYFFAMKNKGNLNVENVILRPKLPSGNFIQIAETMTIIQFKLLKVGFGSINMGYSCHLDIKLYRFFMFAVVMKTENAETNL